MADQPDQQYDGVIFNRFDGLVNTRSAERLRPTELERAVNIDLDDIGQIHRRRGYRRVAGGDWHSLFQAAAAVYGVKDGRLVSISTDYRATDLGVQIDTRPVGFAQVGADIYFSSESTAGVIHPDGAISAWAADQSDTIWFSPVPKPTSTLNPIKGKMLRKPPLSSILTYFNGRIYLAKGNVLWATELYMYLHVDVNANYLMFESEITAVGAVTDGLYVGTKTGVYFLAGRKFREQVRMPISQYGVIPGTMLAVPAELINPKVELQDVAESKNAVVMMTTSGLLAGFDGGVTFNLTQNDMLFPDASSGAAMLRRQDGMNQIVTALDSGGTPAGGMRIGDYVDAQLIRFGNTPVVDAGLVMSDSVSATIV
jgi:hypothetical protein